MVAPLASVVVPSLNGAHLLPDCLDSLVSQSYANLEVVVADGASTDGTVALLAQRYPSVRLVRLPRNLGFSGNVMHIVHSRAIKVDTRHTGRFTGALTHVA